MHTNIKSNFYTYVYRITHLWHSLHYYGVRYAVQKYSDIALEDLRLYQSSSSDEDFKKEMREHPERFKFKIVKAFKTDKPYEPENNYDSNGCIVYQAKLLEYLLQTKFQVDINEKFYNRHIFNIFEGSEWDGAIIWDLANSCEYTVNNAKEFSKEFGRIDTLVSNSILKGRFCEIDEDLQTNKDRYTLENTVYIWYRGINEHKKVKYKDCRSEIGISFLQVINGEMSSANGWFLNQELCIFDYTFQNTTYVWFKNLERKEVKYKDCRSEIGINFIQVINGEKDSTNGYYLNQELCISNYTFQNTTYIWFKGLERKEVKYKDCSNEIGKHFTHVVNGRCSSISGWFLDEGLCVSNYTLQNTIYTWYKGLYECKKVMYKDCVQEIGPDFNRVVKGKTNSTNGYFLDQELCLAKYK